MIFIVCMAARQIGVTALPSRGIGDTMKLPLWICALGLLASAVYAEEFKLTNGKTVTGDLSRVEPDGLVLITDAGVEKIPFLALPEETQKRFNFDYKKAEEYRAQQAALRKQLVDQQAAAIRGRAARIETLQKDQPSLEEQQRRIKIEADAIDATATVLQGTSKGAYVRITVQTGRAARTMLDKDTRATAQMGDGYVYDLRAADGDTWKGKLYPAGLYIYKTEEGVEHTLRAYATTSDVALAKSAVKGE